MYGRVVFCLKRAQFTPSIPGLQNNSSIRSCQRPHIPSLSQVLHVPLKLLLHMAQVAERQKCGTMAEPAQPRTRNLTNYLVNVSKPRSWPNLTHLPLKLRCPIGLGGSGCHYVPTCPSSELIYWHALKLQKPYWSYRILNYWGFISYALSYVYFKVSVVEVRKMFCKS